MFTLQQIKDAHSKVKSGAGSPRYIQELKHLGITRYEFMVSNGDTVYFGDGGYQINSGPRFEPREIKYPASIPVMRHDLQIHQQGGTDFPTFCVQAAGNGVAKWVIDFEKMLCTYYDLDGKEMIAEPIPEAEYVQAG